MTLTSPVGSTVTVTVSQRSPSRQGSTGLAAPDADAAAIITRSPAEASVAATTDATRLRARPTTVSSAVFAVSA
ncbi:hypothetical protein Aph01nite_62050 [Acrocarpospora phusangensis]|uniref:Uncharacterized protein n=1 Tax=Acrocarpospora phusangensis TaxID=1070424 RepID=A0A919QKB6_9ACTN|nr:hypothetical protein Aph01nite_62050 [Acrocarpospora phusangensis]